MAKTSSNCDAEANRTGARCAQIKLSFLNYARDGFNVGLATFGTRSISPLSIYKGRLESLRVLHFFIFFPVDLRARLPIELFSFEVLFSFLFPAR